MKTLAGSDLYHFLNPVISFRLFTFSVDKSVHSLLNYLQDLELIRCFILHQGVFHINVQVK